MHQQRVGSSKSRCYWTCYWRMASKKFGTLFRTPHNVIKYWPI